MKVKYPKNILILISFLKKLPGVGTKTAERFAFELIKWNELELEDFGKIISTIKKKLKKCQICGCLTDSENCPFCEKRESNKICIISSAKDAFTIEDSNSYSGYYHVINLISPMEEINIDEEKINKLEKRIEQKKIEEIIIAFDSTLEGDATALFLKNRLKHLNISISRIAFGMPLGSSFEYIDGGTLVKSFMGRQNF